MSFPRDIWLGSLRGREDLVCLVYVVSSEGGILIGLLSLDLRFLLLQDTCDGSCGVVYLSEDCYITVTATGFELAT